MREGSQISGRRHEDLRPLHLSPAKRPSTGHIQGAGQRLALQRETEAGLSDCPRPRPSTYTGTCPVLGSHPPGTPDDAAVVETLSDPQLHRQVGHRPAGVVADEVCQLLQDLHMQDVAGALVEGRQLRRIMLEVHEGIRLHLQLEKPVERGHRRTTQK